MATTHCSPAGSLDTGCDDAWDRTIVGLLSLTSGSRVKERVSSLTECQCPLQSAFKLPGHSCYGSTLLISSYGNGNQDQKLETKGHFTNPHKWEATEELQIIPFHCFLKIFWHPPSHWNHHKRRATTGLLPKPYLFFSGQGPPKGEGPRHHKINQINSSAAIANEKNSDARSMFSSNADPSVTNPSESKK